VNKEINNNTLKIIKMPLTKSINITSKDYTNIEKVFHTYLQNNPKDQSTLKTIQSIINQSID
jgi:hypothetical protein